jgi:hypothetical protein
MRPRSYLAVALSQSALSRSAAPALDSLIADLATIGGAALGVKMSQPSETPERIRAKRASDSGRSASVLTSVLL